MAEPFHQEVPRSAAGRADPSYVEYTSRHRELEAWRIELYAPLAHDARENGVAGCACVVSDTRLFGIDADIANTAPSRRSYLPGRSAVQARYSSTAIGAFGRAVMRRPYSISLFTKIAVRMYDRADIQKMFADYFGAATKQKIAEVIAKQIPALNLYVPIARKPWMSEQSRMGIFEAAALTWMYYQDNDTDRNAA